MFHSSSHSLDTVPYFTRSQAVKGLATEFADCLHPIYPLRYQPNALVVMSLPYSQPLQTDKLCCFSPRRLAISRGVL